MAYENTVVSVPKTQDAIRKMILGNGGSAVAFVSQPPMEGFEAMVLIDGASYKVRISAEVKVPERKRRRSSRWGSYSESDQHDEYARRVWRVLYFYLKSVYEAASSGVMDFRELIMPYVVTKDGKTVSAHILPKLHIALQGNPERMLPESVK